MPHLTSSSLTGDLILLRTATLDAHTAAFAARLADESSLPVACVVDERNGRVETGPHPKISLTKDACSALGLFCPRDFAWRCGDYGLYLARKQFPRVRNFWLIEGDVRISGGNLRKFFELFVNCAEVDFIGAHLRPSGGSWYWDHAIAARGSTVFRCLFDVLRVSAPAIDRLLTRRQAMSRSLIRRASWPNDEGFLATTLANDGFLCRDLNSFGPTLYTDDTLTFHNAFNGNTFVMNERAMTIYHPVLYGEAYRRKLERLQRLATGESIPKRARRHLIHFLNARSNWNKLA